MQVIQFKYDYPSNRTHAQIETAEFTEWYSITGECETAADGQSTLVFCASDGTRFTSADRNATNTYDGSPLDRARAYAAKQMEAKMYARA